MVIVGECISSVLWKVWKFPVLPEGMVLYYILDLKNILKLEEERFNVVKVLL